MQLNYFIFIAVMLKLAWHSACQLDEPGIIRLPHYSINPNTITLSGFSSGGTLAQQVYLSYSSLIRGIAVFSHSTHHSYVLGVVCCCAWTAFYRCGPVTTIQQEYDNACTLLGGLEGYDPIHASHDIQAYFADGLIENPRNLLDKPLYVYAGTKNWLFSTDMSLRIVDIFEPYIRNPTAIRTVVQNANLTFPTDKVGINFGHTCNGPTNDIAVSSCGLSGPLDALQFLLGKTIREPSLDIIHLQPLLIFDQSEFFGRERHDMDDIGYLYVPTVCRKGNAKCHLHFYFHGCNVGRMFVGEDHVQNSGFLEVAEQNGIITVFPQAVAAAGNDIGCWDTYGFTGPFYATQRGAQVSVIRKMLERFLQHDEFDHSSETFTNSDGFVPPQFVFSKPNFDGDFLESNPFKFLQS